MKSGPSLTFAVLILTAGCSADHITQLRLPESAGTTPSAALASVTTTNLVVTPASPLGGLNVVGAVGDYAPGYPGGSVAQNGGAAKSELYFPPALLFGRDIAVGEIATMEYWTKTGATHASDPRDWFMNVYTKPFAGDASTPTWYGSRIGTEPYFSVNLSDPAGSWTKWSTNGATNTLRFFESTQGAPGANFGSYLDPTWSSFSALNSLGTSVAYSAQDVLYFSLQTATSWTTGFTGQLDGMRITLTDGSVATVNFEPAGAGFGPCLIDHSGTTYTLLADCVTSSTLLIPDGYTLNGNGFKITAVDPAAGHFLGAVVKNGGTVAYITDVTITASGLTDACDAGDNRLRGILFDGADGSITSSTVDGVRQGLSGCQEGNAIEVRNFDTSGNPAPLQRTVTISGNSVVNYQKNGITANGNVAATILNNNVAGDGPITYIAQNGIQIGFGATAKLTGNSASGNDYTPKGTTSCGLLMYKAAGVSGSKPGSKFIATDNSFTANEDNVCNFGKGGGFSPTP